MNSFNKLETEYKVENLKQRLTVSRLLNIILGVMCCFFGYMYITNNNALVTNNVEVMMDYESQIQSIKEDQQLKEDNYEYLLSKYDEMMVTIDELISISNQLDEQNKSLVESNQQYYEELEMFKEREELFNKYEWAMYNEQGRNDITFEQLSTLQELVADSEMNDENLILTIIMTESRGIEKAKSSKSTAKGYGQFLDSTSKFVYTDLLNKSGWSPNVSLDGDINLEMTVAYVEYLYKQNDGDLYALITNYRGLEDTDYLRKIDSYLAETDRSIEDIQLACKE